MTQDLPSSGRLAEGQHVLPVRVYYEDTDFTGVVYHATYLRFFERGRSEFLRVMGTPTDRSDHGIFAVTRVEIDYKAPARIHDALIVRTEFEGMKGPRLNFRQWIERSDTAGQKSGKQVLCEAVVIAVAIHEDGRVRRPSATELTHWNAYRRPSPDGPTDGR